jgi:hypothetical protein
MLLVFVGMGVLIAVFVLGIPSLNLKETAKQLKIAFFIFPNFAFSQGMVDLFQNYNYIKICTVSDAAVASCARTGFEYNTGE